LDVAQLAADYERAELTVVWLQDRNTNEDINVFSVIELCPTEQECSALWISIVLIPLERYRFMVVC
jgi:hypothetical protein